MSTKEMLQNGNNDAKAKRRRNGEGSIRQLPNKTWVGKLMNGRKANGTPNIETFTGKTEAEVRKKIKEFNKKKEDFSPHRVKHISFEEYVNNWLYHFKRNELKDTSFDRLESTIRRHVIPNLGMIQLSNITGHDIQLLINKMYNDGLSHSSIKKAYDALNSCFVHAVKLKDLSSNPVNAVNMISTKKFDKSEVRYFTDKEKKLFEEEAIRKYMTGTDVYYYGYAFIFMLNTGIREGEMCAINYEKDIDLDNKLLHIKSNVVTVKERDKNDVTNVIKHTTKVQDTVKTYSGDRIIPLNKTALECIQKLRGMNPDSAYLICTKTGSLVPPHSLNKAFTKIIDAAGLERCGVHTLRHTFASTLFENGIDVKTISELLGHANVTITYNTYIHLIKKLEAKAKAVQIMDKI